MQNEWLEGRYGIEAVVEFNRGRAVTFAQLYSFIEEIKLPEKEANGK